MEISNFDLYLVGALKGEAKLQTSAGYCVLYGEGVARHYGKARMWFEEAAKQGDADAFYFFGQIYYYGYGVNKNHKEALS